jgi:hypothetical protein
MGITHESWAILEHVKKIGKPMLKSIKFTEKFA